MQAQTPLVFLPEPPSLDWTRNGSPFQGEQDVLNGGHRPQFVAEAVERPFPIISCHILPLPPPEASESIMPLLPLLEENARLQAEVARLKGLLAQPRLPEDSAKKNRSGGSC